MPKAKKEETTAVVQKENTVEELLKIDEPTKAIALYDITPAKIAEQLKKYDPLKVIMGDTASYKVVRAALTAIVHLRVDVDNRRKDLGKKLRDTVSNINTAGKMLIEPTMPYENRFSSELKAEDDRKDKIREDKALLERERIEGIRARISLISEMLSGLHEMDQKELKELSDHLEEMDIGKGEYQEFAEEATKTLNDTFDTVQDAITARIKLDEEDAARKAEDERLEGIRKVQEEAQKAIDAANQKIQEEKDKLEAEKAQADERRWRFRLDKLATVTWNGQKAIDPQTDRVIISYENLIDFSDAKFAEIAAGWNHIVEERQKAKAEEERKAIEEFNRQAKIKAEADAAQKVLDDAKAKEEKQKAEEAEKARQAEMAPDKEKLLKFTGELNNIGIPYVKSAKAKEILSYATGRLDGIASDIKEQVEEL